MNHYRPPLQRALPFSVLVVLVWVQALVVLPFLRYLPAWLGGVLLLVLFWRWRVMHGEMRSAPRWLMLVSVAVGIGGLFVSGLTAYSLDSAVALCVLGYLLKSLEVLRRRDGVFQVYLGFFLAGVYLLYDYDPLGAALALAMLTANTLGLHAITAGRDFRWVRGLRLSLGLVAAAIPIMVVGFLFFPRLPPLWSIPNDQRGTATGMTDEVEPGRVAELARDESPAFRVRFDGARPPRDQWYWRGTTLGQFDGRRWRAWYREDNRWRWPRGQLPEAAVAEAYSYTVIMEASRQHWLYFLDWPTAIDAEDGQILPDGRAARRDSLNQSFRYRATSAPEVSWPQAGYPEAHLELPEQGNEALRRWAERRRAAADSDADFLAGVLRHIREQPFFYTLQPSLYQGPDSLAEFWLAGRRGFCTHYASAVAYIARAAGIPSRLVGGYLGGVYNPGGDYIQVRQMEAHAWVEVWLDGRWRRIDPTAAVAPGRVDTNLDDWLDESNPAELPLGSRLTNRLSLLNDLGLWWDSVQYQWQVLVLDYQQGNALGLLEARFGRISAWQAALAMGAFLVVLGVLMAWATGLLRLPRRRPEPWASLGRLEKHLGPRHAGETPARYLERKCVAHPDRATHLVRIQALIQSLAYDPDQALDEAARARLKALVRAALA